MYNHLSNCCQQHQQIYLSQCKAITDFANFFQQRADIEKQHAQNIQKLAMTIETYYDKKDSLNGDLVDLFMCYKQFLDTEIQQSLSFQDNIEQEISIHLKNKVIKVQDENMKGVEKYTKQLNQQLFQYLNKIKSLKDRYYSGYRELYSYEQKQLKGEDDINMNCYIQNSNINIHLLNRLLQRQIEDYNNFMTTYSQVCNTGFTVLEQDQEQRTLELKDSIRKIVIFEVSCIKNLEYEINNLNNKMQKFDPQKCKILIPPPIQNDGFVQIHYDFEKLTSQIQAQVKKEYQQQTPLPQKDTYSEIKQVFEQFFKKSSIAQEQSIIDTVLVKIQSQNFSITQQELQQIQKWFQQKDNLKQFKETLLNIKLVSQISTNDSLSLQFVKNYCQYIAHSAIMNVDRFDYEAIYELLDSLKNCIITNIYNSKSILYFMDYYSNLTILSDKQFWKAFCDQQIESLINLDPSNLNIADKQSLRENELKYQINKLFQLGVRSDVLQYLKTFKELDDLKVSDENTRNSIEIRNFKQRQSKS